MSNEFFMSKEKCFLKCELDKDTLLELIEKFPIKQHASLQAFSILIGNSASDFFASLLSQLKPGFLDEGHIEDAKQEVLCCLSWYIDMMVEEEKQDWMKKINNEVLQ